MNLTPEFNRQLQRLNALHEQCEEGSELEEKVHHFIMDLEELYPDPYLFGKMPPIKIEKLSERDLEKEINHCLSDLNSHKKAMLLNALEKQDVERACTLIDSGTDVDTYNHRGDTALILATKQRNQHLVEKLLDAGATVSIKNREGKTALDIASNMDDVFAIEELLELRSRYEGVLIAYATYSDYDVSPALLANCSPNARDDEGQTALHRALLNAPDRVQMLLALHPDPNIQDDQGVTPLMLAAKQGLPQSAIALREAGADPSLRDNEGRSALDYLQKYFPQDTEHQHIFAEHRPLIAEVTDSDSETTFEDGTPVSPVPFTEEGEEYSTSSASSDAPSLLERIKRLFGKD